ncbi:F5/8 type C domain-containing protein [Anseongella ginsenosidimutans]|uniref:F5/8 type C domain-containing protein n=1 Tax=Anseongella ginsenosidimutans TaxID=496056 RepID=A0A4R3KKB3_9SPHI|nr:discoidin domain-containing protein [Anseongella ginsenosidimutans]QEC54011.1 ATP/GTP-binding protein [Anseongella ginsenosidimutans]TCS84283.1 F5/8 type C domain-containing protein [Anseongella ginsenosidimutans]
MKRLNYYIGFTVFLAAFAVLQGCSKDEGFYSRKVTEKDFEGSVLEYLESKPGIYDSLLLVTHRLGLEETLQDSAITLFALTNSSFGLAVTNLNNLRETTDKPFGFLSNIDYLHLDTMMSWYIIRGKYEADSLTQQDGLMLEGVRFNYPMHAKLARSNSSGYEGGGPKIIEFSNTNESQFLRYWVTTTTASVNVRTRNGVIHVLTPDHIFGFNEFVSRLTFNPPPPNLMLLVGGTFSVSKDNNAGPGGGEGSLKVIDNDVNTKFLNEYPSDLWMQYVFNEPVVAGAYTVTSANDAPDRDPRDWNFQGSHDGETWVQLDKRVGEVFEERYQTKVYRFNNDVAYTYYRINITRNYGSNLFQLAEWTINKSR